MHPVCKVALFGVWGSGSWGKAIGSGTSQHTHTHTHTHTHKVPLSPHIVTLSSLSLKPTTLGVDHPRMPSWAPDAAEGPTLADRFHFVSSLLCRDC
ncbi:hypothetical protein LX36DRAFT_454472 [Colletotrichum falcatum]|nr:hypothetical protein LX36DRAFT_454472 [Colletotrichum falcatum]